MFNRSVSCKRQKAGTQLAEMAARHPSLMLLLYQGIATSQELFQVKKIIIH